MLRLFLQRSHSPLPLISSGSLLLLLQLCACGAEVNSPTFAQAQEATTSFACSVSQADLAPTIHQHGSAPAIGASGKLTIDGSPGQSGAR